MAASMLRKRFMTVPRGMAGRAAGRWRSWVVESGAEPCWPAFEARTSRAALRKRTARARKDAESATGKRVEKKGEEGRTREDLEALVEKVELLDLDSARLGRAHEGQAV